MPIDDALGQLPDVPEEFLKELERKNELSKNVSEELKFPDNLSNIDIKLKIQNSRNHYSCGCLVESSHESYHYYNGIKNCQIYLANGSKYIKRRITDFGEIIITCPLYEKCGDYIDNANR
jgi:hypothetical protein